MNYNMDSFPSESQLPPKIKSIVNVVIGTINILNQSLKLNFLSY